MRDKKKKLKRDDEDFDEQWSELYQEKNVQTKIYLEMMNSSTLKRFFGSTKQVFFMFSNFFCVLEICRLLSIRSYNKYKMNWISVS